MKALNIKSIALVAVLAIIVVVAYAISTNAFWATAK